LFVDPMSQTYRREAARVTTLALRTVQRELAMLEAAGFVTSRKKRQRSSISRESRAPHVPSFSAAGNERRFSTAICQQGEKAATDSAPLGSGTSRSTHDRFAPTEASWGVHSLEIGRLDEDFCVFADCLKQSATIQRPRHVALVIEGEGEWMSEGAASHCIAGRSQRSPARRMAAGRSRVSES